MVRRKGLGKGLGKGYKNIIIKDPLVHGMSSKGIKQKQWIPPIIKFEGSKQYREAKREDYEQFIGLKSKPYQDRSFVIDERDAKLIVANIKKDEYELFKREFKEKPYSSFRLLQDFSSKRERPLSAREIVQAEYGSSRNFMTPNLIKYGKIDKNTAYEISSGEGIERGTTIYGVSVVKYDPKTNNTSRSELSKSFSSRSRAEDYIESLKGE